MQDNNWIRFLLEMEFYIFSIKEIRKKKTIYLKKTLFHEINYKYYNIDDLSDLTNSRKLFKEWKLN